jgi:hypothetical protein
LLISENETVFDLTDILTEGEFRSNDVDTHHKKSLKRAGSSALKSNKDIFDHIDDRCATRF